jgi:hypothetical protein
MVEVKADLLRYCCDRNYSVGPDHVENTTTSKNYKEIMLIAMSVRMRKESVFNGILYYSSYISGSNLRSLCSKLITINIMEFGQKLNSFLYR